MSNRVHSLTVVLEQDVREDALDGLITSISHIRGVLTVGKNIADTDYYVTKTRLYYDMRNKLFTALEEMKP
jgi:hypothetical protein